MSIREQQKGDENAWFGLLWNDSQVAVSDPALRDWRVHIEVIINLFLAEQRSTNSKYAKNRTKYRINGYDIWYTEVSQNMPNMYTYNPTESN